MWKKLEPVETNGCCESSVAKVGNVESTGIITERHFPSPGGVEDKVAVTPTEIISHH